MSETVHGQDFLLVNNIGYTIWYETKNKIGNWYILLLLKGQLYCEHSFHYEGYLMMAELKAHEY